MRFPGLGTWIDRRAARSPDEVAFVGGGAELTYGELAGRTRAIADALRRRGVERGDRVAYHGGNHVAALTSLFATTSIGAVWVPIHPARPEDEVRAVIEDSGATLVVRASPRSHPEIDVAEIEADELPPTDPPDHTAWTDAAAGVAVAVGADDLAILAYTSGTTGSPKGVKITHANVAWSAVQMMAACAFAPTDVTLAAAPFTRMGGLGVTVLPTLLAGGRIVVPPAVSGAEVLDTICRERVTVLFANPDLLDAIVRTAEWPEADLTSVRTGVVGGGVVPEPLLRAYFDRGVRLRHGYGLTEASPVVSMLDEDEAVERADTVGRPLPFVDVRAVRPDGSACDSGEVGEWLIRGPNVSEGYWGRPVEQDADGWFPTGDVGSIDDHGYLCFLDRASAAMVVGDAVVYPATVERALYGAPGVADVSAAEVDGLIAVVVVSEPGASIDPTTLLDRVRASLPPGLEIELRHLDTIPRNAAGKVRRAELQALLERIER